MFPQPGNIIPDVDIFSYLMIPYEQSSVASTVMTELSLLDIQTIHCWSLNQKDQIPRVCMSAPVIPRQMWSTAVKSMGSARFNYEVARIWHLVCYPQLGIKPPTCLPHVHKAGLPTFLSKLVTFRALCRPSWFACSPEKIWNLFWDFEFWERFWL